MTLLPTFLAGTNFVMHAAGWLEGGLVSCYRSSSWIDPESLAFGAHAEIGHGGHLLGAEHPQGPFTGCLSPPLPSSTADLPPTDETVKAELEDVVTRPRAHGRA